MGVDVSLDIRGLDALLAGWDDGVERLVDSVAHDVLASAQQNIRANHQIRTGNMLNSGVVKPAEDRFSRYVHFTASYSAYQELGTRYMAGRPFLLPAVEHHRRSLQDDFSALIGHLVER